MYKLLHWLFGWDYIYWKNTAAHGIARVHVNDDKKIWYFRYTNTQLIDEIISADQVLWLTCSSLRYFGKEKEEHDRIFLKITPYKKGSMTSEEFKEYYRRIKQYD